MVNLQRGLSFGKEPFWHENFLIFKSKYILDACWRWLKIKFHYGTSLSNDQINLKHQFYSLLCKWWTKYFSTSFDYYFKGLTWWNFNFWSFLTWMPNLADLENSISCQNGQFLKGLPYRNGPFWYENFNFKKSSNIWDAYRIWLRN